jgi:CheY-like chemotaxis protein
MSGSFKSGQKAQKASSVKLVVIIDDDPLVLEAIGGLLRRWGFRVVAAASGSAAMAQLAQLRQSPHLIICDYRLSDGTTGIEVIERLRDAFRVPALLITGDATPELLREAHSRGYHVLHKPVESKTLRAMLNLVLKGAGRPQQ